MPSRQTLIDATPACPVVRHTAPDRREACARPLRWNQRAGMWQCAIHGSQLSGPSAAALLPLCARQPQMRSAA